jgi:peptidoglycan/xylan/chitin deacetylase (PgdA/CDA1 family)
MKKIFPYLLSMLVLIGLFLSSSSTYASHVVTPFRDNKKGAVSISFDDGSQSQFTNGVPQMNARNIRGTFFIITSYVPYGVLTWENLRQLASQGHEIGSHTLTHADLASLSATNMTQVDWELSESQRIINLNIPAASCVSFAYPSGRNNAQVEAVTSKYYIDGRNIWNSDQGSMNYYENGPSWQAADVYNLGSYSADSMNIGEINTFLNLAEQRHAWFSIYMHEVQNPTWFGQLLDDILMRDLWIDTIGSIVRYVRERLSSTVIVLSENSTGITLDLTHSLDSTIYNQSLTLRSTVPSSWSSVEVRQGKNVFTVNTLSEGAETVVYYNALPNMGTITLTPSGPLETVSAPSILSGTSAGTTGVSYVYSTGGSSSSLGHAVEYQFDWNGDGVTNLSSWGSATRSNAWIVAGTYNVKVRARCITDTSVVSSWSSPIVVNIAPGSYTLTVNVTGSGSVTKSPNQAQYTSGTVVQLTPVPASGWVFSGWSGDLTGNTTPASLTMNTNKTVTATFVQAYTLTVNVTGSGSVIKSPDQAQYASGTVVQLTPVPNTGWVFSSWSGACSGTSSTCQVTMNSNTSVSASFTATTTFYTITASTGTGGSISPSGSISVASGGSQSFTITPQSRYRIFYLLVDNKYVSARSTYTFSSVKANHSIKALFIRSY